MRAIRGPAPPRVGLDELREPLEALRGVSRAMVDECLDRHGLMFHGFASLQGMQVEINMGGDHIGYVAPMPDGTWTVAVFRYQAPDAPEPAPRSRAVRLQ